MTVRYQRGPGGEPFAVEINVDTGMGREGVLESGVDALRQAGCLQA